MKRRLKLKLSKKQLVTIFLSLCLTAPVVFNYAWLECKKYLVRKELKGKILVGMNKKDLILLKFTRSEAEAQLDWEHSDEFEYKDQMYDVVESKVKGDTTYYWCWPDDEETKLDSTLDKLLADSFGKDQQQKDNQRTVISIFKSLYCEKLFNWHLLTVIKKPILHLYSLHFNSVVFPPPVPPPETAFCL